MDWLDKLQEKLLKENFSPLNLELDPVSKNFET